MLLSSYAFATDEDITLEKSTVSHNATKVAIVNIIKLMEESPRAKNLYKDIKKRFVPQEQKLTKERILLDELEKKLVQEGVELSDAERLKQSRDFRERKRQYKRAFEEYRDQLTSAKQDAVEMVRQEILDAINTVRENNHIDIVFENYVSASKDVDITQAVIQYLETNYKKSQQNSINLPAEEK